MVKNINVFLCLWPLLQVQMEVFMGAGGDVHCEGLAPFHSDVSVSVRKPKNRLRDVRGVFPVLEAVSSH